MLNRSRATIVLLSVLFSAGAAHAGVSAEYGAAAPAAAAERTVELAPGAKWVNVANGETVRFTAGGKSFSWRFQTLQSEASFELSKIAPAGAGVDGVQVYVAPNPLYRG